MIVYRFASLDSLADYLSNRSREIGSQTVNMANSARKKEKLVESATFATIADLVRHAQIGEES